MAHTSHILRFGKVAAAAALMLVIPGVTLGQNPEEAVRQARIRELRAQMEQLQMQMEMLRMQLMELHGGATIPTKGIDNDVDMYPPQGVVRDVEMNPVPIPRFSLDDLAPAFGAPTPPQMHGGTAITVDGTYIYVVQGGTLFQIDKADMRVVNRVHLMPEHAPMHRIPSPAGGGDN